MIEFSRFAKTLKPIIGEEASEDVFTQTLFVNITSFPDEDENVVENTPLASYKSYYTGRRGLSRFAPKIIRYLEPERFVSYIGRMGDAAQKEIFHVLFFYDPEMMTHWSVPEACARMFKEIILRAAKEKGRSGREKSERAPAGMDGPVRSPVDFQRCFEEVAPGDLYLLVECGMKCPVCGRKLLYERNGIQFCRFQVVPIFPPGLENAERVPFEEKWKAPDRMDRLDNRIMLCEDCAEAYRTETTPEKYFKMCMVKEYLKNVYGLQKVEDTKDIEKGIEEILYSLSSMKCLPKKRRQRLKALTIDEMIPEEEFMLREKVTGYVLKYYRYIERLFIILEGGGKLRYKKVQNVVNDCFEALNQIEYSRSEIFDQMVEWMMEHTGNQKREACEAVISFFIQNCEVFDELAQ